MNNIGIVSVRTLTGCLIGFLIGCANCISFHAAVPVTLRPLADSVYEIGGAVVGGATGLVIGIVGTLLAARRHQSQSNA